MATTETILVLAEELRLNYFPEMKITHIPAFYNKPEYVKVLSKSIKENLKNIDLFQNIKAINMLLKYQRSVRKYQKEKHLT